MVPVWSSSNREKALRISSSGSRSAIYKRTTNSNNERCAFVGAPSARVAVAQTHLLRHDVNEVGVRHLASLVAAQRTETQADDV
jgi:hypothetical protein